MHAGPRGPAHMGRRGVAVHRAPHFAAHGGGPRLAAHPGPRPSVRGVHIRGHAP
jgi:hypothetical protein